MVNHFKQGDTEPFVLLPFLICCSLNISSVVSVVIHSKIFRHVSALLSPHNSLHLQTL